MNVIISLHTQVLPVRAHLVVLVLVSFLSVQLVVLDLLRPVPVLVSVGLEVLLLVVSLLSPTGKRNCKQQSKKFV